MTHKIRGSEQQSGSKRGKHTSSLIENVHVHMYIYSAYIKCMRSSRDHVWRYLKKKYEQIRCSFMQIIDV